ncbi:MAG: hypothetical protein IPJ65_14390 [Archangiaceae bacterium]|nr:hypothetical protein [Archangiaceae bacterium]
MIKSRLAAVATAFAVCGCAPPSGSDGGTCAAPLAAEWGRSPGCVFAPFADGEEAELTLGFQGFRFIDSAVRLTGATGTTAKLSFELAVEGQPPATQTAGTLMLSRGPDGAAYAQQVLVFFNEVPLVELLGRRAEITLGVTATGCAASHRVAVTLVDRDLGVQGVDAGFACPD